MAHIHTKPGQHDFTSSAYIVLVAEGQEPRVVMHRHRTLGRWLHIGGHIELDETPWQALVRELLEESGYDMKQLQILQPAERMNHAEDAEVQPQPVVIYDFPYGGTSQHYHTDIAYAFVTSERPAHPIAAGESQEVVPMTAQEISALSKEEIPANVRDAALYVLDTIYPRWQPISCAVFDAQSH